MSNFIKLHDGLVDYYVNFNDINYVTWYEDVVFVYCSIEIRVPLEFAASLRKLIASWITTYNETGMIYINPASVSVLTKAADVYKVWFKNTKELSCTNINCKSHIIIN